jgi:hypothetical protein
MVLTSSTGKFMAEHGVGSFERAKRAKTGDEVKEPRKAKTPRHIVRSKTPKTSKPPREKKKDG